MADRTPPLDPKRIKALGDRTRVLILEHLAHRLVSASELAVALNVSQNVIDYHLNVLVECECVDVAITRHNTGGETPFYTARASILFGASPLQTLVDSKLATKEAIRVLACRARSILDAGPGEDNTTSVIAVETLALTGAHRLMASQALRATVANLRVLHEQSRHLSIVTDAPLIPLEVGIAMFEAPGGQE